MALFKKKSPAESNGESEGASSFEPQPEKAKKWFDHARTGADSSNFVYALHCYASGLKYDPSLMSAHEAMYEAAVKFHNAGGKPASSKEVKSIEDSTPVGKFAAAEYEWMRNLLDAKAGVRALEAAVKADQHEFGNWMAPKLLNLIRRQKKQSKSTLLQAMKLFAEVNAWDQALQAGEMARDVDPSDADLANEIKNLSAQRAMDQGGYGQAGGEEGGFRQFVKDADRQREIQEQESIAGGGSVEERNLARAKQAYGADPALPENINRYAQLVKRQGTPEAMQLARDIYLKGFEATNEYRFRIAAGDIEIEQLEQEVRQLSEKTEKSSGNEQADAVLAAAREKLLEQKLAEYTERVERYPTDRFRKYDLGVVQYELKRFDEAMAQFQKAKDEPKLRVRAGHMLGRCFLAEKWYGEAIDELQEAAQAIDATERDRELLIRYDLMIALLEGARDEQSIDLAKQAKSICSEIARQDITYRDIRTKRKEVDELIRELSGGAESD